MKVLMSSVTSQEAVIAWQCGADIINISSCSHNSFGASFPSIIQNIIAHIPDLDISVSATLGDLSYQPDTAALAALGAVSSGAKYVKVSLHSLVTSAECVEVIRAVVHTCKEYDPETIVVAVDYADYLRLKGLPLDTLIEIASESGADMVMLDTFIKNSENLFDVINQQELRKFVHTAHQNDLKVILAGSIQENHLNLLAAMDVDVVGVRGAVCESHDRSMMIDREKAKRFISIANQIY